MNFQNSNSILFFSSHFVFLIVIVTLRTCESFPVSSPSRNPMCTAELENKFLPKDGKCRFHGQFAVKGSCSAYVPCIRFGGDVIKPLQRMECSPTEGLAFDVKHLRCRPVRKIGNCLQRECYPEDGLATVDDELDVGDNNDENPMKKLRPTRRNDDIANGEDTHSSTSSASSLLSAERYLYSSKCNQNHYLALFAATIAILFIDKS